MKVMDAEWTPTGTSDPAEYSRRCQRKRESHSRHVGAFVQRLAVGAAVSLTSAVLLAVMMGVWR